MECATALPWLKRRSRSERSVSLVSIQTRVFGEGAIDGFLPGLTPDKVDKPVKLPSNHKEIGLTHYFINLFFIATVNVAF